MRKPFLASSLILSLIFSSCIGFRIAMHSLGDTFSSGPEKVLHKVKEPIKDNVRLSVLWIGHSSMLVQVYDRVLLFDPMFNKRLAGLLMRKREPGLDFNSVSRLDMVLVSHSHMDHMSFSSLKMIAGRFPGCTLVFPEGDEDYLPNFDMNLLRVKTGKYWDNQYLGPTVLADSIRITPVYAYHTGGRYVIDTYIWKTKGATGYIVQYKDVCIYFAGDTGYNEYAFKNIGKAFKIDLAFIPIGPCRNCDSTGMKYHASSLEALEIFSDLNAEYMIPIHYGTLTYFRDADYPGQILRQILQDPESGFYPVRDRIKILGIGEQIIWPVDNEPTGKDH